MELERLLAEHPWPPEMLAAGRPLDQHWTVRSRLPPEALWGYLRDTSRLNRALGLGEMRFEEDEEGRLRGRSETAGVLHLWTEHPWSWVAAQQVVAVREYHAGLAHWVRAIYRFEEQDGGTLLSVYFGWIPRGLMARVILASAQGWLERSYSEVVRDLELHHLEGHASPWERGGREEPNWGLLRAKQDELLERGVDHDLVAWLGRYLAEADDLDLHRIRVLELAREWELPWREVLEVALHATRVGLLTLSWDVMCPHCRGVRESHASLSGVPSRSRCPSCVADFDTDRPEAIEVVFHVHPAIREVPEQFYCSAEPAQKAHVALQQRLGPGETRRIQTTVGPGCWKLRAGERHTRLVLGEGPEELHPALDGGPHLAAAAPLLSLRNETNMPLTFVLEEETWSPEALQPARLFGFQGFRDLFAEEMLDGDVRLALGEQTVLFTDVVGSTRLYLDQGDPAAFSHIKQHFDELLEIVRENEGAVVKTIGDALMAAFSSPTQALQAALEMQEAFGAQREDSPVRLRISLNAGPCIAVRLNSNIDYFGTTVNFAAKLQAVVEGGQVAFSDAVAQREEVCDWLQARGLRADEATLESPALGTHRVWRFTVG